MKPGWEIHYGVAIVYSPDRTSKCEKNHKQGFMFYDVFLQTDGWALSNNVVRFKRSEVGPSLFIH